MFKVFLYDLKQDTVCFLNHNLTKAEAREQVADLRKRGLPAFIQKQEKHHRTVCAEACNTCSREFTKILTRIANR